MHTVSYEFLMKPEESAGCHQTLSSRVGSGHETTQRMASSTLSVTSHVSASPATMNNLLNLVTDPVQPAHHCYQPQSD